MTRRRMGVILAGVALAVAAVAAPVHAQGPQRGNRGGPGGGPGGFGGGPGGFGGGPGGFGGGFGGFFGGGSLVDLARGEAVQKEIKVTEEQKPQIQDLSQQSRSQRDRTMRELRERSERARAQVQNSRPATPPITPPPANNNGGFGGEFGVGGYGSTGYGEIPQQGPTPAQMEQMAQMQQRQQEGMVRMQGFEQMRQAMDGLQRQSDQALAKILDKDQMTRLREIKLQMEGPFAILSNQELAQKLSVTPQQMAEIRDVSTKANESRRQDMMKRRNIFETVGNAMRQANANAGAQANANGQDGNPAAGQGRGGRGNFDREAFRKVMERPEVKAELDQIQQHENSLRDQSYARVFKALDRRQSSTYKKMLGEPFDVNAMMRGFFTGRGGGDQPNQPADASANAKTDAKATANADADTDAPAPKADAPEAKEAPAATTAPAPAPAPTGPRSSLRERRGGSSAKP